MFLNALNSFHPSIKFTSETECGGYFSFLDAKICRYVTSEEANKVFTRVFRKSTYTHLLINWKSWCPKKNKIAIIKGLHERARRICTTVEDFKLELAHISNILKLNGYPRKLISNMEGYSLNIRNKFGILIEKQFT